MKKAIYALILGTSILCSCKKTLPKNSSIASLTIVNAVVSGPILRLGSNTTNITNNSAWPLALTNEKNELYLWPLGDSLHPYYTNSKLEMEDRAMYSLYIGGTRTTVESILVKENFTDYTDSICGIRFVNLSPNSKGLNITLSTSPNINEITNLEYKQISDFKIYPGKASNIFYTFQVRNPVNNAVLVSYLILTPRFAHVTLVIRGLVNSAPSIGIIRVNNDR